MMMAFNRKTQKEGVCEIIRVKHLSAGNGRRRKRFYRKHL